MNRTIAVFGSGSCSENSNDYQDAVELGSKLAGHGFDIITGGYKGIMEASLKGASEFDVQRIGVSYPCDRELNQYVNQEIKAESYIDRMIKLIEDADVYVIFPGSSGTLLELSAVWALAKRGEIIGKQIICYKGVWKEVVDLFGEQDSGMIQFATNINEIVRKVNIV